MGIPRAFAQLPADEALELAGRNVDSFRERRSLVLRND
jgi:hypothetical protein